MMPSTSLPARRTGPWLLALLCLAFVAGRAVLPSPAVAGEEGRAAKERSEAWRLTPEILEVAARIPVQHGGRVKPLVTFAGYTLLGLDHRRSTADAEGESLSALAWLLEVIFRPERARRIPCFLVESDEVIDAIGLSHAGKKKRDRYAYEDLLPARATLSALALQYLGLESTRRSSVEEGIVALDRGVATFERLAGLLDFARAELDASGSPEVTALFGGRAQVGVLDVLERGPELTRLAGPGDPHGLPGDGADASTTASARGARVLRGRVAALAEGALGLSLFPPPGTRSQEATWYAPGDAILAVLGGHGVPSGWQAQLGRLGAMQRAATGRDASAFLGALEAFQAEAERAARDRGEVDKLDLEVFLVRLDPFHRGVHLYLLAFLLVGLGWLVPSRWQRRAAWTVLLGVLGLHVTGIVIRCVLRERPPISTLYETVLFISALAVAACVVAERIDRRGIAFALAPLLGWLGLFVSNRYEALKGEDSMPQLVAVLDTNFWLATHVTCIAIGYSGSLVASALAHVTVLGSAFGLKRHDEAFHRAVSRMTYGMLCFGLLFSVVGTILGGIWANESWGRFWGWDPKENGALMICLAELAILHARQGGYVRAHGLALCTVAAGCVVAFSWWGVNLLGVGLHTYGFTGGVWAALLWFYGAEACVLTVGLVDGARRRRKPPVPA